MRLKAILKPTAVLISVSAVLAMQTTSVGTLEGFLVAIWFGAAFGDLAARVDFRISARESKVTL